MNKQKGVSMLMGIIIIIIVAIIFFGGVFAYEYFAPKEFKTVSPTQKIIVKKNSAQTSSSDEQKHSVISNNKVYTASISPIEEGVTPNIYLYNNNTKENKLLDDSSVVPDLETWQWFCWAKSFSPGDTYLLIDCGTGPLRSIIILKTLDGKKVTSFATDEYSWIDDSTIKYLDFTDEQVTRTNCPNFDEYVPKDVTSQEDIQKYAGIFTDYSLNLSTLQKTDLGDHQCRFIQ
jgi:hypothetical protein